jgi:hypothetical protein
MNQGSMIVFITGSAHAETPPHPDISLREKSDLSPQAGRGKKATALLMQARLDDDIRSGDLIGAGFGWRKQYNGF